MLAYLFFHRPAPEVEVDDYEEGLRSYHAALAQARMPGFVSSRTYRIDGAYCDWYLMDGTAVMDALNSAAVSGPRAVLHDSVARRSVHGVGKLMKLAAGSGGHDSQFEIRFSKPKGMGYPELYAKLEPWTGRAGTSLWRRMMVLGPPPEFCLLSDTEPALPADMDPTVLARGQV